MMVDSSLRLDIGQAWRTCRLLAAGSTIKEMDPAAEALKRLIGDSVARRQEVADSLGFSEQYLYQIANGILLKSGKPRVVGRKLREALDRIYPGWLSPLHIDKATTLPPPDLPAALPVVLDALRRVSAERQQELLDTLRMCVLYGTEADRARLAELLDPQSGKRREAAA